MWDLVYPTLSNQKQVNFINTFSTNVSDFSKIQLVVYYISMLHSDWLSYYQANNICYSPLVAKRAGFLAAKKGLKSSLS